MKTALALAASIIALAFSPASFAEHVIDISGVGTQKFSVQIGVGNQAFAKCLARNLELSGLFKVGGGGSIRVSGGPGALRAEGGGKVVVSQDTFADDKSARMAARRFADSMVATFSNGAQQGFACDRVLFLNRGRQQAKGASVPSEMCISYPDGFDIRQLTSDAKMTIYPRWHGADKVIYISDRNGAPQVWEMDLASNQRRVKWSLKGTPAGIAVSPDGTKIAAILSFHGNPELYVISGDRFTRLTNTPLASEGQPTWSPDGRKIAYVSNETRHPQIYVIDVATKAKRRLTSKGRENVDPDWGPDGRIAYITKRGGSQVAVMNPADGDSSSKLLTGAANWEHPSWSRDARHLTANRDKAVFLLDALEGGDDPKLILMSKGSNFISPCWAK